MASPLRLNPVIAALESGQPAFVTFATAETEIASALAVSDFDGVVYEMEHRPYDIAQLRICLQFMLNRGQIARSGSVAPAVAPMVRIPPNGGEMNQWIAKQVLDVGVYGVIWPQVETVEQARNAVSACRYPRPRSAPYYEPAGQRGDSPKTAIQYWGVTQEDYYERADVWPLNPKGEILVGIMCESARAIENLPDILDQVPGIGVVLIGEGDLSQDLGFPRQYDHPDVVAATDRILAICQARNVACGLPHQIPSRIERSLQKGFRWLMPPPERTYSALEIGRRAAGRS